jgi:apolipoprotein N-acyltransferase
VLASRNWLIVFVYPALLAAIDTLVSFFSPHGTWGSFAYTQMDALPVIQIASVLGAPAIVFLVGLFASTVAVALYRGLRIERPLLAYGKQHLVPHLESDLAPGKEEIVRTISGAPFGLAICRDLIFTDFGRRYGRLGVSAMFVPAWDFYRDAWMASGAAALRGVESGYSVVRAGRESYLNVSDRYGHTIARQRSDYLPGSSVLADMPLGPATPTLYARYGNAFGWLSVAASAMMIVLAGRAGNQPKPATANA